MQLKEMLIMDWAYWYSTYKNALNIRKGCVETNMEVPAPKISIKNYM